MRTLGNLQHVDAGFNRAGLVLFRIDAASAGYTPDAVRRVCRRGCRRRMERLPASATATFSSVALLSRVRQNKRITRTGHAPPPGTSMIVNTNGLAPNFFHAMELPLVLGRGFTEQDDETAPRVAVVNQAFVAHVLRRRGSRSAGASASARCATDQVEIVGVAADAKYTELRGAAPPTIYLPARQRLDGDANFAVRVAARGARPLRSHQVAVFAGIRGAVREVDPALPVLNLRTQDEQIDRLQRTGTAVRAAVRPVRAGGARAGVCRACTA